jgi:hypothetical protein
MPVPIALFNSHLLIPHEPDYVPSPTQVHDFVDLLVDQGILVSPVEMRLRVPTDEDLTAKNPMTGESVVIGKRLQDIPVSTFAQIAEYLPTSATYVVSFDCSVRVAALPFDLLKKDGSLADKSSVCPLHLTCVLRDRRTQLSESWHEHLRRFLLPDAKAARACPECGAIHTPEEEVQPRFWIEFSFGDVFLPGFGDTVEPIHRGMLAQVEQTFATRFFHARFYE